MMSGQMELTLSGYSWSVTWKEIRSSIETYSGTDMVICKIRQDT